MPGLITNQKIKILKEADFYFINELEKIICITKFGKLTQRYQSKLSVLWEIIEHMKYMSFKAITSEDGMTADFFSF